MGPILTLFEGHKEADYSPMTPEESDLMTRFIFADMTRRAPEAAEPMMKRLGVEGRGQR